MRSVILALFSSILLISCSPSLSPYTARMQDDFSWTEEELKSVQFYLSNPIVLFREVQKGDVTVREGKIRLRDGRKVEEIVFSAGTPGIYLFSPKSDHLAISFESGGSSRYLIFGPNPKFNNRYKLLAKEWNRNGGLVRYDGRVYQTTVASARAGLEVNLDKVSNTSVNKRRVEGRRVGG